VVAVDVPIDGAAAAAECLPVFSDALGLGDALPWNNERSIDFAQDDTLKELISPQVGCSSSSYIIFRMLSIVLLAREVYGVARLV
jgi:hypothetical protein